MMTEKDIENFKGEIKTFCEGSSYKEDLDKAIEYSKKHKGTIYTMIDTENNKTAYWKGIHLVNRFGYCVLLPKGRK